MPHHGKVLGGILGEISEDEVDNDRPPLSSIVVLEDTIGHVGSPKGHPAKGFLQCKFVPVDLNSEAEMLRYMRDMQEQTWGYWATR